MLVPRQVPGDGNTEVLVVGCTVYDLIIYFGVGDTGFGFACDGQKLALKTHLPCVSPLKHYI